MDREAMQMALDAFDYFFPTEDGQLWHTANDVKKIDDARQALQQALETEHDPVAWRWKERINNDFDSWVVTFSEPPPYAVEQQPLYTAPPQRQPLTHPQIHELDWPEGVSFEEILPFVRAIEAAHGIKEKNT